MRFDRMLVLLALSAGCATTDMADKPPQVVMDPSAVDLGVVFPTRAAERKLTVADLRAHGPRTQLRDIEVSGPGAEWVSVRPIVPLPSDLVEPNLIEVTVRVPEASLAGPYAVVVSAVVDDGTEQASVSTVVSFDVGLCDADADGFQLQVCGGQDCDDTDPLINPAAVEICNGVDDDCNNVIDDAPDLDGDGYSTCFDCDDADPQIRPGAPERCNGLDDDCDGEVSNRERDGDGDGLSTCDGDCNDLDPDIYPGAPELCNGLDDDCDGLLDDAEDADGDSFTVCEDCDDEDRFVFPGAPELCDGQDNDCDGVIPPAEADLDGDGVSECELDCDDADPDTFPGNTEACDGQDNDCDEEIDEDGACPCDRVVARGDVYLFCSTALDWPDAQRQCASWGYHLLTIDNAGEDSFAFGEATDIDGSARWWMGFNDRRSEGTWVWEDGSRVTYTNWGSGEPNDTGAGEDCGQLNRYSDGAWNDEPCSRTLPYVCELD